MYSCVMCHRCFPQDMRMKQYFVINCLDTVKGSFIYTYTFDTHYVWPTVQAHFILYFFHSWYFSYFFLFFIVPDTFIVERLTVFTVFWLKWHVLCFFKLLWIWLFVFFVCLIIEAKIEEVNFKCHWWAVPSPSLSSVRRSVWFSVFTKTSPRSFLIGWWVLPISVPHRCVIAAPAAVLGVPPLPETSCCLFWIPNQTAWCSPTYVHIYISFNLRTIIMKDETLCILHFMNISTHNSQHNKCG